MSSLSSSVFFELSRSMTREENLCLRDTFNHSSQLVRGECRTFLRSNCDLGKIVLALSEKLRRFRKFEIQSHLDFSSINALLPKEVTARDITLSATV